MAFKMNRKALSTAGVMVLGVFTFYACGGGGGGGGGGSSKPTATVDEPLMTEAMGKIGDYMPGCQGVSAVAKMKISARQLPLGTLKTFLNQFKNTVKPKGVAAMAATPINETTLGNCPGHQGNYTRVGSHNSGVTTITLTYNDYCTRDSVTGVETFQDGVMSYVDTGTPSDSGPVRTKVTAKTGSDGVCMWTSDGLVDETITFSGMTYRVGTPGEDPTSAKPNTFVMSSLKIEDNVGSSTQRFTDVDIDLWQDGTNGLLNINSATLSNSNGTMRIETTTPISQNDDGEIFDGTIVVTGKNSESILDASPSEYGVFDVTVNGTPIDTNLDCSDSSL